MTENLGRQSVVGEKPMLRIHWKRGNWLSMARGLGVSERLACGCMPPSASNVLCTLPAEFRGTPNSSVDAWMESFRLQSMHACRLGCCAVPDAIAASVACLDGRRGARAASCRATSIGFEHQPAHSCHYKTPNKLRLCDMQTSSHVWHGMRPCRPHGPHCHTADAISFQLPASRHQR